MLASMSGTTFIMQKASPASESLILMDAGRSSVAPLLDQVNANRVNAEIAPDLRQSVMW
jgi:hypothetical protein